MRKKQLILAKIQNIIYISPKQEIFDFESTWDEKETSASSNNFLNNIYSMFGFFYIYERKWAALSTEVCILEFPNIKDFC